MFDQQHTSTQLLRLRTLADLETILPSIHVVAAAFWEIDSVVREAQCSQPDPGICTPNRLFVPESARSVLQWGRSYKLLPIIEISQGC